ncbi:hypothetical protein E2C01_012953 [Portunus trituberculatus]|uniref:Uncharacterized protein n=1 Tax=Portunus trituberculatus TaxID=210409 RepID=A0A5B7DFN2_PORTR|nr:hypothetical protein [Portunus trituberculatus]
MESRMNMKMSHGNEGVEKFKNYSCHTRLVATDKTNYTSLKVIAGELFTPCMILWYKSSNYYS